MNTRKLHLISGLTLSLFIAVHLINHLYSLVGADRHIAVMTAMRSIYRNPFIETILTGAVFVQILSGLKLFFKKQKTADSRYERLQLWTGLYLAIFLIIHIGAVFAGRLLLGLDTNFYFGVAGLNSFPINIFFIPYYAFAIISVFGHIAAIHRSKTTHDFFGLTPSRQAILILALGLCLTIAIFSGLTNHFRGIEIPAAYHILIGK